MIGRYLVVGVNVSDGFGGGKLVVNEICRVTRVNDCLVCHLHDGLMREGRCARTHDVDWGIKMNEVALDFYKMPWWFHT